MRVEIAEGFLVLGHESLSLGLRITQSGGEENNQQHTVSDLGEGHRVNAELLSQILPNVLVRGISNEEPRIEDDVVMSDAVAQARQHP